MLTLFAVNNIGRNVTCRCLRVWRTRWMCCRPNIVCFLLIMTAYSHSASWVTCCSAARVICASRNGTSPTAHWSRWVIHPYSPTDSITWLYCSSEAIVLLANNHNLSISHSTVQNLFEKCTFRTMQNIGQLFTVLWLVLQSINNAHKYWVCGLALLPGGNCLLSGCRGGMVKLWHIDSCASIGEMKAHESPINAVTTNESLVFTASE
jgi:WD40 repeat protein